MVFYSGWIDDDLDIIHLDALAVTESLIFDKRDELHHFAMRLDLSHVFLYGKLLAAEQTTLFALVNVQTGKSVDEKIGLAVMIVSLNHNVCNIRGLLLLLFLEFDGALAEVVREDQNVVIVS